MPNFLRSLIWNCALICAVNKSVCKGIMLGIDTLEDKVCEVFYLSLFREFLINWLQVFEIGLLEELVKLFYWGFLTKFVQELLVNATGFFEIDLVKNFCKWFCWETICKSSILSSVKRNILEKKIYIENGKGNFGRNFLCWIYYKVVL